MNIKHLFVTLTLLALLSQTAMANTTVTLTGSCYAGVINQSVNYIVFNLSNSGNGPASDIILAPAFEGATTPNSTANITTITPGSSYSTKFYLYNFTAPGSYAEYITVKYSQGSSSFVTVFPCLVSILKNGQSLLQIMNISRTGSKLTVDVINLAKSQINANVTVTAPLTFKISPSSIPISVGPGNQSEVNFSISTPSYSSAQFPVIAAVSYSSNGMHLAALSVHVIGFAASSSSSSWLSMTTLAIIMIIIIIALLLVASILRKRKPKAAFAPVAPQPAQAT
jgi:hypothetical protein